MNIILYTQNCPKCKILETKLKQKSIEYTEVNDVDLMLEKGFTTIPMLEVDGEIMDFKKANDWINNN